jgi:hypothetical protein
MSKSNVEKLLEEYEGWKSREPKVKAAELSDFGYVEVRPDVKEIIITGVGKGNHFSMDLDAAKDLCKFLTELFR